jgi:hypothetical protein
MDMDQDMRNDTPVRPPAASRIPGWGVDARPEQRPGVPMERPIPPAVGSRPEQQVTDVPIAHVSTPPGLTPVFGTTVPPHGLSGRVRRRAYRIPGHRTSHWALLLLADRIDVMESGATRLVQERPLLVSLLGFGVTLGLGLFALRRRWA